MCRYQADLDAAINSLTYTRATNGVDDLVIAVNDLKNQGTLPDL